ncbi:MAG: peptide chain release factor N(5)-glutamine methyltransferase [Pseudomonadota bacterium]
MSGETVDAALRRMGDLLVGSGIDDGRREARLLIEAVIGQQLTVAALSGTQTLNAEMVARLDGLAARRATREPLQHILGETGFMSIAHFKTDARALIPRWDSETVVLLALERGKRARPSPRVIADLGTGSGALLAALLQALPHVQGVAVEKSAPALSLAKENVAALGLSPRVSFFPGSWTDWTGWNRCDLIISNPPYIRSEVIPTLAPEVRDHDPIEALDGGADGLDAYRDIIALGADQMKAGAHLVLEIGHDQRRDVTALLDAAGFIDLTHQKDLGGHDRAIAATKA